MNAAAQQLMAYNRQQGHSTLVLRQNDISTRDGTTSYVAAVARAGGLCIVQTAETQSGFGLRELRNVLLTRDMLDDIIAFIDGVEA